ncbi:SDR family oxidoreductase [Spirillospora sp. NPDC127200]
MILVTGATGTLGRALVPLLTGPGAEVHGLSRRPRRTEGVTWHQGDLATGAGVAEAVKGAGTIVHCASDPRRPKGDAAATERLVEEARRQGGPHLVHISIVGVDRHPFGYYRTKFRTEQIIENSGLPYTILRTTQFHDLLASVLGPLSKAPALMPLPAGTRFQPIDVAEVAARLAELARAAPAGRVADMGGPEVRTTEDLARAYLASRGLKRRPLPVRLPGAAARAFRDGVHLAPGNAAGGRTWEEYLRGTGTTH